MVIDFHTHLFPKKIRENRQRYFAGEKAFELLYSPENSRLASSGQIVAAMDEAGVDKSVIFGFVWRKQKLFGLHNDYILEAAAKHPKRLLPFACFDVEHKNAPKEALRCLEAGMAGIGELAFYRSGIDNKALAKLDPIMEIALAFDKPVLIHTNEPVGHNYPGKTPITLAQIYNLVLRYPQNKIVLAHWGGGIFFYALMKKNMKEALKNVWLDTAASPYLYDPLIFEIACRVFDPAKILFGTDFPLLKAGRYFKDLEKISLSPQNRALVLGENAAGLLFGNSNSA
ncbi:MAG: amidohydrolase family protein [Desulfatibacillaceae bacterium]|nr:amidohydrolase family protein [Desulfatibacillaceae bacterium]